MPISIENISNLGRRVTVIVPAEEIEKKVEKRIQEFSRKAKMDGFREGKVPVKVIKDRYGKNLRDEVIGDTIQSSLFEELRKENINPAGAPTIENIKAEAGNPLEYVASFEVYPQINLVDFKQLSIEKPVVSIADSDIDQTLENIRKQQTEWQEVDRPAKMDDMLYIDFEGSIDDVPFKGGSAKDAKIVLGSKTFIPGFEDALIGAKKGENKSIELTFPADYRATELAGKKTKFAITVHSVNAPKLPEIDEAFIKRMGIEEGTVEAFRSEISKHMQRELERTVRFVNKNQVLEQLIKLNPVELPKALVEREYNYLHEQMHKHESADHKHSHHEHPELHSDAARRVTISLLMAEILKQNNIKPDYEKVEKLVEEAAQSYADPASVKRYFLSNKESLQNFEAMALEEQLVDFMLENATIKEKSESYADFMKLKQD